MTHMQPFFAALQDIMLASDQRGTPVAEWSTHDRILEQKMYGTPAPQRACQYCGGSGQSHSAYGDRDCNHCGDGWDGVCDGISPEEDE